jgi:glutamate racemase
MIGVFDSGFGGLSVLKYFLRVLPGRDFIYFGDNARAPYGPKSQELIYSYTEEIVEFLFKQGCELVIVACNSASSQALRKIQQEYLPKKYPNRRVLGVIRPLVEAVAGDDNINRVGVIGTRATIDSNVYKIELDKIKPGLDIYQKSAPLLVPLIEEGWSNKKETRMILKKYLRSLKEKKIQALILACTHYPFLIKDIREIMGKNCLVPDPGEAIAQSLVDYLRRHEELEINENKQSALKFYTSDNTSLFKERGEKFLGQKMKEVTKV